MTSLFSRRGAGRVIYDNYLQIYIELSKFVCDDTELSSARDELLYVLRNLKDMEGIPEWVSERDNELTQICNTAMMTGLSDKEKEEYMSNEERERDYQQSIEQTARAKFEEGLEKGLEQGLERGREEGLERGMEKGLERGREEGLEKGKIEVAKAMKKDGLAPEVISRYSGLTVEQVKLL